MHALLMSLGLGFIYLYSDSSIEDGTEVGGGDGCRNAIGPLDKGTQYRKGRVRTTNKVTHLPGFTDSP